MLAKNRAFFERYPEDRERMVRILSYEGYETRSAESGLAGVSIAHAFRPDVILCDAMMPDGDGFEALAMLRQHLDTETIPVIFVSAAAVFARGTLLAASSSSRGTRVMIVGASFSRPGGKRRRAALFLSSLFLSAPAAHY